MIVDNPQIQIEDENILTVLPVASKETSILKKLYQHEQKSSLISPLSIDQFVGIIYPLFRPEEQEIILQEVFGTKNKESVTRYLLSMFENHPQLKLGNCCASTIDLSLLNEHLELLHCLGLNLDDPYIVERLNDFVKEKTDGMIPKIFEQRRDLPKEGLVAVNAGSFIGKFDDPFDPSHTKKKVFQTSTKEKKEIDMMWGMKRVRYYENGFLQFIELELEGSSYRLQLSIPKGGIPIEKLLEQDAFYEGSHRGKSCYVDITLPKFSLSNTQELLEKLLETGIPLNKETEAGKLASVVQKTFFVLEEGGVKAAFVTAGLFRTTSVKPLPSHTIRFDRPFTFRLVSNDRLNIMEGVFNG